MRPEPDIFDNFEWFLWGFICVGSSGFIKYIITKISPDGVARKAFIDVFAPWIDLAMVIGLVLILIGLFLTVWDWLQSWLNQ